MAVEFEYEDYYQQLLELINELKDHIDETYDISEDEEDEDEEVEEIGKKKIEKKKLIISENKEKFEKFNIKFSNWFTDEPVLEIEFPNESALLEEQFKSLIEKYGKDESTKNNKVTSISQDYIAVDEDYFKEINEHIQEKVKKELNIDKFLEEDNYSYGFEFNKILIYQKKTKEDIEKEEKEKLLLEKETDINSNNNKKHKNSEVIVIESEDEEENNQIKKKQKHVNFNEEEVSGEIEIILPIQHTAEPIIINYNNENTGELIEKVELNFNGNSKNLLEYYGYYNDCKREIGDIKTGIRVSLIYKLICDDKKFTNRQLMETKKQGLIRRVKEEIYSIISKDSDTVTMVVPEDSDHLDEYEAIFKKVSDYNLTGVDEITILFGTLTTTQTKSYEFDSDTRSFDTDTDEFEVSNLTIERSISKEEYPGLFNGVSLNVDDESIFPDGVFDDLDSDESEDDPDISNSDDSDDEYYGYGGYGYNRRRHIDEEKDDKESVRPFEAFFMFKKSKTKNLLTHHTNNIHGIKYLVNYEIQKKLKKNKPTDTIKMANKIMGYIKQYEEKFPYSYITAYSDTNKNNNNKPSTELRIPNSIKPIFQQYLSSQNNNLLKAQNRHFLEKPQLLIQSLSENISSPNIYEILFTEEEITNSILSYKSNEIHEWLNMVAKHLIPFHIANPNIVKKELISKFIKLFENRIPLSTSFSSPGTWRKLIDFSPTFLEYAKIQVQGEIAKCKQQFSKTNYEQLKKVLESLPQELKQFVEREIKELDILYFGDLFEKCNTIIQKNKNGGEKALNELFLLWVSSLELFSKEESHKLQLKLSDAISTNFSFNDIFKFIQKFKFLKSHSNFNWVAFIQVWKSLVSDKNEEFLTKYIGYKLVSLSIPKTISKPGFGTANVFRELNSFLANPNQSRINLQCNEKEKLYLIQPSQLGGLNSITFSVDNNRIPKRPFLVTINITKKNPKLDDPNSVSITEYNNWIQHLETILAISNYAPDKFTENSPNIVRILKTVINNRLR